MSSPAADGKMLVNAVYHSAVLSGLAIGFAKIEKMVIKSAVQPKLDFGGYDMAMVVLDVGLALATRDLLIKQGILPSDILK